MENKTGSDSEVINLFSFQGMGKIPRLYRDVMISEKIDGTNASIHITDNGELYAGKRTSFCTVENDNYGFAAWVNENRNELRKLGPGRHFGEWYGRGINRSYGLQDRRFALFRSPSPVNMPSCVHTVPLLYCGVYNDSIVRECIERLISGGSVAVPGWMKPEGVVVYHKAAGRLFKVTCENDTEHKGTTNEE